MNSWFASWNIALDRPLYGNPLIDWLVGLGISLTVFVMLWLVRQFVGARARHATAETAHVSLQLLRLLVQRTTVIGLLAISLLAGSKYLELPRRAEHLTSNLIVVLVLFQAGLWASIAIRYALEQRLTSSGDRNTRSIVAIAQFVGQLLVWATVLLLTLDNLGFEVKTLLAGLGIGGIAVALAVQNVLGDLLASVSIALDKPFGVGDALVLDNGYAGTVEAIGIKSTRLRSATGEQIVVANAELVKARIRNFERLLERRAVIRFGVSQDTRAADLAVIPELVRAAITARPGVRFERAHLVLLGVNGIEFEASFVIQSTDYVVYLDAQQGVLIDVAAALGQRSIALAKAS